MRILQSTISTTGSTIGNAIVRLGSQLIVRVEVLRSLCANSLAALAVMCGMKPRVRTARCFAYVTVKQSWRRHDNVCHHPVD